MKKDKSIEILEKERCSGCSACYPICPTNAIIMEYNDEGFLYPTVIYEKCTNCGLCSKICPELHFEFNNNPLPVCYAMQAKDDIRWASSSGGMFTILADYIFEKGGFVCGVAFNKNENWKVEHIIIDKREDLEKLRGSKYVQSDKKDIFKKIKELLNKDKWVLFSGVPCEVAGLKNYLGKVYDKLITVDLLCASVESPKIWEKYLTENFIDENNKIKDIKFRDKTSFGWALQLSVYFENGDYYRGNGLENEYCRFYESKIMSRKSCRQCSFSSIPRVGDITIGDFWNVDYYDKRLDDKKGTSLILSNNSKGDAFLKSVKEINKFTRDNIILFEEIPLSFINDTCNRGIFSKRNWNLNDKRELFSKKLKLFDFNKVVSHFFDNKSDVGLVGFNGSHNYGSILNTYSVYNLLEKLGYITSIIVYVPKVYGYNNTYGSEFHKKYYQYTKSYSNKHDMYELNNDLDTFVVGSDQVFTYGADYFWDLEDVKNYGIKNIYYLSFANLDKNLISFASSYGRNCYWGDKDYLNDYKNILMTSYHLGRFDHISVREKDSIGLIKRLFNIENVEQVIEPVFILDYEEWDKIIANSKLTHKGKLAYYILDPSKEKEQAINYIADKLNIETIDASNNFGKEVEDFLYIIKNADFVITDSFHGTCFSIIFQKQFISFLNSDRGALRFHLFEELKVNDRIINNLDELKNKKDLFDKIDYGETFEIIKQEKERAIHWLENALKNKRENKITPQLSMIEYLIYENEFLDLKLKETNNEIINLQNKNNDLRNEINNQINDLYNFTFKKINEDKNWIKLFGIYNTKDYLIFYLFGIKITFKMDEKRINNLAWWIPIKKLRDKFRNKFKK